MTTRYRLGEGGTLIDTDNDLIWKLIAENSDNKVDLYTYNEAKEKFKGFDEYANFDDWRLPTKYEWKQILDSDIITSLIKVTVISSSLKDINFNGFWSSSTDEDDYAWQVSYRQGKKGFFKDEPDEIFMRECSKSNKAAILLCRSIDD